MKIFKKINKIIKIDGANDNIFKKKKQILSYILKIIKKIVEIFPKKIKISKEIIKIY